MSGKVQEVTVYQTTDGKRWDTIQEATEKQRVIDLAVEMESVYPISEIDSDLITQVAEWILLNFTRK